MSGSARRGRASAEGAALLAELDAALAQDRAFERVEREARAEIQALAIEASERGPGLAIVVMEEARIPALSCLSALGPGRRVALVDVAQLVLLGGELAAALMPAGRIPVLVAIGGTFSMFSVPAPGSCTRSARTTCARAVLALDALVDDPRATVAAVRAEELRIRGALASMRAEVERVQISELLSEAVVLPFGAAMASASARLDAAGCRMRGTLLGEEGAAAAAHSEILALALALDLATKSARRAIEGPRS